MQAAEIQAVVQKIQAVVLKPSKIMLTTRARDALSAKRDCNVARAEDALSCNVGSCGQWQRRCGFVKNSENKEAIHMPLWITLLT